MHQQALGSIAAYVDHMLKAFRAYRGSCTRFDRLPQVTSVELKALSLKRFLIKAGTDLERVRVSQLQFMVQATSIVNTRYLPLPTYRSIWWQQCCTVVNVGTKKRRQYLSLLNSPFPVQQHRSVILHWYSTFLRLTIRGSCTLPQDATSGSLWTLKQLIGHYSRFRTRKTYILITYHSSGPHCEVRLPTSWQASSNPVGPVGL